jgi:hypothetical protein
MTKSLSLALVCLFLGTTAMTLSGKQGTVTNIQNRGHFVGVGAWRLALLETEGPDGKIHKADSTGLLIFTQDGHISVQVMERNPPPQTSAAPEQYSQGGYEASFGTYQIDESAHTFTYHVEGALVRNLIGKDLPRAFALSGKQLIVKSSHPDEHWKATWEHY